MTAARSAAVLTVSDGVSAGTRRDESGDLVESTLRDAGFGDVTRHVVPDDVDAIRRALQSLVDDRVQFVVTTGGTGLAPRDVTPEATRMVVTREAPGLAELVRLRGLDSTPHAALSRAIAGTAGTTLVVNLAGSVNAVREGLEALLPVVPHALDLLAGDSRHGA